MRPCLRRTWRCATTSAVPLLVHRGRDADDGARFHFGAEHQRLERTRRSCVCSVAPIFSRPAATSALTCRSACWRPPADRRPSKRTAVWTATAARWRCRPFAGASSDRRRSSSAARAGSSRLTLRYGGQQSIVTLAARARRSRSPLAARSPPARRPSTAPRAPCLPRGAALGQLLASEAKLSGGPWQNPCRLIASRGIRLAPCRGNRASYDALPFSSPRGSRARHDD
jgi:hypothetical protein